MMAMPTATTVALRRNASRGALGSCSGVVSELMLYCLEMQGWEVVMSERAAVRVLPWLWPVLLTLLITAPLLAPGYVVGYDLVFVPDLTLRLDLFGVTTAMP